MVMVMVMVMGFLGMGLDWAGGRLGGFVVFLLYSCCCKLENLAMLGIGNEVGFI